MDHLNTFFQAFNFSYQLRNFMSDKCFDELIINQNYTSIDCLTLLAAKLMGIGIIAGAMFVKVPQILKIMKAGSAEGIALSSVVLELVGYLVNVGYNMAFDYPFSTWGEYLFLSAQDIVIVLLVLYYNRSFASFPFVFVLEALVVYFFFSGFATTENLRLAQALTIPLFAVSKIPQIWNNFKKESTGQLSAVTLIMNFAGSLGRVLTTLKQVDDFTVLAGFLSGTFLNFALVAQLLWYWGKNKLPADVQAKAAKAYQTLDQGVNKLEQTTDAVKGQVDAVKSAVQQKKRSAKD